ncbi:helix-turn-helix domain-containing protein [Parafilimonas sp.]|uniref:helix-turn-helix domain-containing protein n=1 Tax=Parafilimonas sp. TaxID=1969739 RepID=UPI0039E2EE4A
MQEDIIIQISNRLKEVRTEKKITLQQLADKAGVTKGLISQIENSRTIPSLTVLINIIRELKLDLNAFFDTIEFEKKSSPVILKKKSAYQSFEKENAKGFLYQRILSTNIDEQHIDVMLLRLQKNARRAMVKTNAYEYKYLIAGKVEYTIGKEKHVLEEGDSIFFDARHMHNPKNIGESDALMLVLYFFIN